MKHKLLLKFYILFVRSAVWWPIWPKGELSTILEAFDVLDRWYGKVVDPEMRINKLLGLLSEQDRIAIYQVVLAKTQLHIDVKAIEAEKANI